MPESANRSAMVLRFAAAIDVLIAIALVPFLRSRVGLPVASAIALVLIAGAAFLAFFAGRLRSTP
jgi:hypothetical protein